jgi:hypothetical protein
MLFSGSSGNVLLLAFGLSLAVSALGFLRSDWFISLGYGLSVSALAVLYGVWWFDGKTWVSMLQLALPLFFTAFAFQGICFYVSVPAATPARWKRRRVVAPE